MANQKNNIIKMPLNGELNFSKMKTGITQYHGFNDLNSPIYGDTISPLYEAERKTRDAGNDRPYVDDDKYLRNSKGEPLINLDGYKGVKRETLKNIPGNALAVRDASHYVVVNEDEEYTSIYNGKDKEGNVIANVLPFEASAAAYSEEKEHLLFVTEKGYLYVYDTNTMERLASANAINNIKILIHTFYDPLNDWHVISMHEPFGDWDYHKDVHFTDISQDWLKWEIEKNELIKEVEVAKQNATASKEQYEYIKKKDAELSQIEADKAADLASAKAYEAYCFYAALGSPFANSSSEAMQEYYRAQAATAKAQKAYDNAVANHKNWLNQYGGSMAEAKRRYDKAQDAVNKKEIELQNKYANEPDKFDEDPNNPNFFYGKVGPALNFFFDAKTNTLVKKTINIPWQQMNKYSDGPSGDSYIITGIYDTYFRKDAHGDWIENTNDDYVRYRLGVIPHSMGAGSDIDPEACPKDQPEYYFTLNYTPKIYFRKKDINVAFNISNDIPLETKTYVTNIKLDNRYWDLYQKTTGEDTYFSGSGKNGRAAVWGKVVFDKNVEVQDPVRIPISAKFDFNKWNAFHDFGDAPYTMYSPWLRDVTGNCFPEPETTGVLVRSYINYDICSSNIFYKVGTDPENLGKVIENNPKNIFREVISNGILSNIAVTEDKYSIGTNIETPGSIEPLTPIYYRDGRDGNAVVYKTLQNEWIEVKVTDEITDIKMLGDNHVIIYTTSPANCIRLSDGKIKHFAPDWNNRFSLVGSPFPKKLLPVAFPATYPEVNKYEKSFMVIASAINANWEITQDEISGYTGAINKILSNVKNITYIGYVSKYDVIDLYFSDYYFNKQDIPSYNISMDTTYTAFSLFGNINLEQATYPSTQVNVPGLFCNIRPSNFGRFYLDNGNTFYSLTVYNGKIYYNYFINSEVSDTKELFMVQGQTFAITKSNYLYSVFLSQSGSANLTDAIINVDGLQFCGAIPEMAIFYSPMDRTLKSFTADHIMKDMQQANNITDVYYTTYSPQTSAVYICTNNGIYVYASNSQYRLPINNVKEIYFGGERERHIYIVYDAILDNNKTERRTKDLVFDKGFRGYLGDSVFTTDLKDEYKLKPIVLETKYFGLGDNKVSVTDCVYFRLYSDVGPIDTSIKVKERTLTDDVYTSDEKELIINKEDWDPSTGTCYVRYQPKQQRSVGLSLRVTSGCSISEVNFSVSEADTVAISKNSLNM